MIGVSQIHMYKPAQGWRKRRIGMLMEYPEQKRTVLTTPVEQPKKLWQEIECPCCGDLARASIEREWVGLTDDEIFNNKDFIHENTYAAIRAMEALLKEKNT